MGALYLPHLFQQQMQARLGEDYAAFEVALQQPAPVSIRVNPKKAVLQTDAWEPVPWCSEGYYLPERPIFTLDPLFQAGAYYVQEASSMLLAEAVRQTVDLRKPQRVLDFCAAPGGKSTLLASLLPENSLLLCNEVIHSRVPVLCENLDKWGYPNVAVSCHDSKDFFPLENFFDLLVVDAPCSGEGLFRKSPEATLEWSEAAVQLCAGRQQRILSAAVSLVREGGIVAYSTCTYNDRENMENADWLVSRGGFESIPLSLPADWGIVEISSGKAVGYQCYPFRLKGEGFFLSLFRRKQKQSSAYISKAPRQFKSLKPLAAKSVAIVRSYLNEPDQFAYFSKPNQAIIAIPIALMDELIRLDSVLTNKGFGLELGQFKGLDFIPSHSLALSNVGAPNLPAVELSKEDALRYFKKENVILPETITGWSLARYKGLNLGWLKGVSNRVNNYLPKDWRIRMEIK